MRRALTLAVLACLASAAPAAGAVDARLEGALRMDGYVSFARDVRGERSGQRIRRTWRVDSTCPTGWCRAVALRRPRAGGQDRLTLRRRSRGVWFARGSFTTALRCAGRTYRRGGLVLFSVTLTVTAARTVQTTPFATRVVARYDNQRRINRTPCPGGLGRDAARYRGTRTGALPAPPRPAFATAVVDRLGRRARFTAVPARGIVAWSWSFGDPASGAANRTAGPDVAHSFTGPGPFGVTLTVLDGDGLGGAASQTVAF